MSANAISNKISRNFCLFCYPGQSTCRSHGGKRWTKYYSSRTPGLLEPLRSGDGSSKSCSASKALPQGDTSWVSLPLYFKLEKCTINAQFAWWVAYTYLQLVSIDQINWFNRRTFCLEPNSHLVIINPIKIGPLELKFFGIFWLLVNLIELGMTWK